MSNPLYNLLNGQQNNMLAQFQDWMKGKSGDPQQIVQSMLRNGNVTQEQVNQAMQMAKQMGIFPK